MNIHNILTHRHIFLLHLLSFIFFFSLAAPAINAKVVDRVVAVVNDDVITSSEVAEFGKVFYDQAKKNSAQNELDQVLAELEKTVVLQLIEQKILEQEARRLNISITEKDIDAAYQRMFEGENITEEQFEEKLAQDGISREYHRKMFAAQILQSKLINFAVKSHVVVTEEMIRNHFKNNYTTTLEDGSYYLLQFGISWGNDAESKASKTSAVADKLAAKARTEKVHDLVKNGGDFRELTKEYSNFPSKQDGGEIGILQADEIPEIIKSAIISLEPGEISEVIETPAGFQFFKLVSNRSGETVSKIPYESVKDKIRKRIYERETDQLFKEWITGLKESAYIKIM